VPLLLVVVGFGESETEGLLVVKFTVAPLIREPSNFTVAVTGSGTLFADCVEFNALIETVTVVPESSCEVCVLKFPI